jgi:hypothetical protein
MAYFDGQSLSVEIIKNSQDTKFLLDHSAKKNKQLGTDKQLMSENFTREE